MKKVSSFFPDGLYPFNGRLLDIMMANTGGILFSILQSYLTDFVSVLKLVDNLGYLDDVYKRKDKVDIVLSSHNALASHSYFDGEGIDLSLFLLRQRLG
jgi:hypothetical protein